MKSEGRTCGVVVSGVVALVGAGKKMPEESAFHEFFNVRMSRDEYSYYLK